MKELNPFISIVTWCMTVALEHCCFMSPYKFRKKEANISMYIAVQEQKE